MTAVTARLRANSSAIAAAAGALAVVATVVAIVLADRNGTVAESFTGQIGLVFAFYVYLATGLVLVVKRPDNGLSWLLLGVGFLPAVGSAVQEYAQYALVTKPGLPGSMAAAWFNQAWWFVSLGAVFVFVPLLFPTGHLPSPRWRWVSRAAVILVVVLCALGVLAPTLEGQNGYRVANPIGAAWAGEGSTAGGIAFAGTGICMLLTLISVPLRFRRAQGVERQQLKWFVFAVAVTVGLPLLELIGLPGYLTQGWLFDVAVCLPPLAIGIAVSRYRLYEIDRVISRTVTYAVLTAILVGVYLAAVSALTAMTAPVTGESPIAVAAATLLAAAAFGPVRRRVQAVVDRRFNRARYDAARTLERFRSNLRDELDLASITGGVRDVVAETVQPARVAVWLRQEPV